MLISSFSSFTDFFHMGGYAYYVWPAYLVVFVVLVGEFLKTRR